MAQHCQTVGMLGLTASHPWEQEKVAQHLASLRHSDKTKDPSEARQAVRGGGTASSAEG